MGVREAVASLRRMAQTLSERQTFLEEHQEAEIEQFCGEVDDLENDLTSIVDQADANADDDDEDEEESDDESDDEEDEDEEDE